MIYINDIYHNSIVIYFFIFLILSKCQHLLLLFTYFSNSCVSNTNPKGQVPKLLDGANNVQILPKMLILWVGRNNVTDE